MTKRRQISLLPAIHQTEPLKRFFNSTVDQLFEDGKTQPVSGYIGRKPAHFDAERDFYKPEPTVEREAYQLEPMMISADESGVIQSQLFYEDLIARLNREGALTNDAERLFGAGYYSWAPPIDIDRIVNFNSYYWAGSKTASLILTVPGVEVAARYLADGFTTEYPVPPVLATRTEDEEDFKVLINGVLTEEFEIVEEEVVFTTAPSIDSVIAIFRYGNVSDGTTQTFRIPAHCLASLGLDTVYVFVNGRETTDFTRSEDGQTISLAEPAPENSHVMVTRIKDLKPRIEGRLEFDPTGLTTKPITALINGMKVTLVDPANFTKGFDLKAYEHPWDEVGISTYYVEGVGVSIMLIPVGAEGDGFGGDDPRYTVMSRADRARGYWSRINRWVHRSALIEETDATIENRAKRPIIEFLAGLRQYGHGTYRVVNATCSITSPPMADLVEVLFEEISGLPVGSLICDDDHQLLDGDIIMVSLEDSPHNNQLWYVDFVLNADDPTQKLYLLEPMGILEEGAVTTVRTKEYFFDGLIWNLITNPEEAPLFMLYDKDGIALDDVGVYPDSDFEGSRIFAFASGNGRVDPLLKKRLSYDKYGQIMFENDLETRRYSYDAGEIGGYYYYLRDEMFQNSWHLADANLITQISENNVENIPLNLQANPDFDTPTLLSRNDFYPHFESIIAGQDGFVGTPYGANNWNDTARDPAKGLVIIQHEAPLLKLMALTEREDFSVPDAIRFVGREYTRFRLKFLKHVRELSYQQDNTAINPNNLAIQAINRINAGKTTSFPFYDSLVGGGNYFIPFTPSLIGMAPLVKPEWIVDDTNGEEVELLRGHDGSLTPRFNDSRDDALFVLEQMIYDNANLVTDRMPLHTVVGGINREALYSPTEFNTIMLPAFEQWIREANLSLNNTTFVEGNPFTYNYRTSTDLYGNAVSGHWRAIYRAYFDTERPHIAPWEMLGFAERPYWWVAEYGNAPYTRGNTIMWDDISAGVIRQGARAGTYPELARPDLMQVLPVDLTGKLLDPIAATIIPVAPPIQFARQNWQFGDGSPVETEWRSTPDFVFALALAKYLMRPAFFVERFWDVLNEDIVHDTQTVQTPEYRRLPHADLYVNRETREDGSVQNSIGLQNWLVDHLLHGGKVASTLGEVIRGLSVQLGHKMAGFTTKDRMTISAESFGLVPDEDITVSLYETPSLNEYFYSGILIENTNGGYRVIGYNPNYPFFDIILPEENSRKINISASDETRPPVVNAWHSSVYYKKNTLVEYRNSVYRCIGAHTSGSKFEESFWVISPISAKQQVGVVHKHTKSSGIAARIEYGTEFRSKQDVADLIFAYERWLVHQGFVFSEDQEDNTSWVMAVKNFLKWSDVEWADGTFMTISPAARQLKFVSERGLVDKIENAVIDRTGHVISRESYSVDRDETETVITAHVDDIYGARITLTEIEHCLIFSNETIFNDTIYDPLFNVRQERLKMSARVAAEWSGRYEAPGFVLRGNEIVPNFHKSSEDIREMFDIELADNTTLRDHARHVIGFENRDYLDQLLMNETQQFELYQGMIQQKGAIGAMSAILRSDEIGQSRDLKFLEEWAFRIGTFGAYHPTFQMEFLVRQSDIHNEKQIIHLLEQGNADWVNLPLEKWVSTPETFDSLLVDETNEAMPDGGYIRVEETTHAFRDLRAFEGAITDDELIVFEGEVLWQTHGNSWDASRLSYPTADLTEIKVLKIDNENSGAIDDVEGWRITFDVEHSYAVGDTAILSGGDYSQFRGVYEVLRVGDTWIEIEQDLLFPFDFTDVFAGGNEVIPPTALYASPLRIENIAARDALPPYPNGTFAYVDDVAGRWVVYRKINNAWVEARLQPKKIENKKISGALIYDQKTKITKTELFVEPAVADKLVVIDPLAGLIPGIVDRELDYKIEVDPADYDVWGSAELGTLWWDLSTVRFINYYTDVMESLDPTSVRYTEEIEYRTRNWAKVTPTSTVDVYEWTRSLVLPETEETENVSEFRYVAREEYDNRLNKTVTAYYFWSLNPSVVPLRAGRRLSAKSCSEVIQNPAKAGLIWYAAMAKTAILCSGTRNLFSDEDRIFRVEYQITDYEGEEHSEWVLMRPGDKETPPPTMLWDKLMDSLRGFDLKLRTLPDPLLHPTQKSGLLERQSMFGDISNKEARESFIEMLNYILARNNYSNVGLLEEKLTLGDVPPEYLFWSAYSGELALLPPKIEYNTVVYDIADVETALGSFERVLLDNTGADVPSWSVWRMGEEAPEIVKTWDRVYATRAEMIADFEDIAFMERALVQNDEVGDGFWSIWEKRGDGLWDVAPFDTFAYDGLAMGMVNAQKYRTRDFWYYADWYDESVDSSIQPRVVYETIGARNAVEGNRPSNLFVKVNDDDNFWSWYKWNGQNWDLVARENATIQLLTSFYRFDTLYGIQDNELFFNLADVRLRNGTLDLSVLVNAIRDSLLTTEEENELWFSMVHFVHSKLDKVDWGFKTSFLNVMGFNERLWASPVSIKDNLPLLLQYIDEVKPYRVKIREILRSMSPDIDIADVVVTDFDRPPYFDPITEKYRRLIPGEDDDILTQGLYRHGTAFPEQRRRFDVSMLFDRVWPTTDAENPSAADRIMAFYQPGSNMREKNLTDLLRLDFKGTVYDGSVLGDTDNDVLLRGSNADGSQIDLNVEGGFKVRDPHAARNKPEELASVGFHDGLLFRAHDRWTDGAPLHTVRNFDTSRATGTSVVLDLGILADSVIVFRDGVRAPASEYTFDQLSHRVTVNLGTPPAQDISLHSFGFAAENAQVFDQYYYKGGQDSYLAEGLSTRSAEVWINGIVSPLEDVQADGENLILLTDTTFADALTATIYSAPNPQPTRLRVDNLVYNVGQTWVLENLPGSFPYHGSAFVEVNGLRLTPPTTYYVDRDDEYYLNNSNPAIMTVYDKDGPHVVVDINVVTSTTHETIEDAMAAAKAGGHRFAWWQDFVLFSDDDAKDRLYSIVLNTNGSDFTISDAGVLTITKTLASTDTISVTTFDNDAKMDIRTHVFPGNPEGYYVIETRRRGSPWFTIDGKRLVENVEFLMDDRDRGLWDLDPFEYFEYDSLRTVNFVIRFPGEQPPRDVVITTFEGREAQPERTWQMSTQAPEEMRLLVNSENETMYIPRKAYELALLDPIRRSGSLVAAIEEESAQLTLKINPFDVPLAMIPPQPLLVPSEDVPGVVWIRGERIEYFGYNRVGENITLSELRRGTRGTAMVKHDGGEIGYAPHPMDRLPPTFNPDEPFTPPPPPPRLISINDEFSIEGNISGSECEVIAPPPTLYGSMMKIGGHTGTIASPIFISTQTDYNWLWVEDIVVMENAPNDILFVGGRIGPTSVANSTVWTDSKAFIAAFDTATQTVLWQTTIDPTGTTSGSVQKLEIFGGNLHAHTSLANSGSDGYIGFYQLDLTNGQIVGTTGQVRNNNLLLSASVDATGYYAITERYLSRHDTTGAELWSRAVNNGSTDEVYFTDVKTLSNGDALASGSFYDYVADDMNCALYRFDSTGAVVWERGFGDGFWLNGDYRSNVRFFTHIADDGKIFTVEHYTMYINDPNLDGFDHFYVIISEIDPTTGNPIWSKKVTGPWDFRLFTNNVSFGGGEGVLVLVLDYFVVVFDYSGNIAHVYETNLFLDVDMQINPQTVKIHGGEIFINYWVGKSIIDNRHSWTGVISLPINLTVPYLSYGDHAVVVELEHKLVSVMEAHNSGPFAISAQTPSLTARAQTATTAGTIADIATQHVTPVAIPLFKDATTDLVGSTAGTNYWMRTVSDSAYGLQGTASRTALIESSTMCIDADGNIYVAGDMDAFSRTDRSFIMKLNRAGDLIWHKELFTNDLLPEGMFVAGGIVYTLFTNRELIRIDAATGALIGSLKYFEDALGIGIGTIFHHNDLIYMGGDTSIAGRDWMRLQIVDRLTGEVILSRTYDDGVTLNAIANHIRYHGGSLYIEGSISFTGLPHQQSLAMKINATTLDIEWQKTYLTGDPAFDFDPGHFMEVDENGNQYRLVGRSFRDDSGQIIIEPNLSHHFIIYKLDPSGNLIWSKSYELSYSDYLNYQSISLFRGNSDTQMFAYRNGKLYLHFGTVFTELTNGIEKGQFLGLMEVDANNGDSLWCRNLIDGDGCAQAVDGLTSMSMDGDDMVIATTRLESFGQAITVMRIPVGVGKEIATQIGMEKHQMVSGAFLSITPTVTVTDFPISFGVGPLSATTVTTGTSTTSLISHFVDANYVRDPATTETSDAVWGTYISPLR